MHRQNALIIAIDPVAFGDADAFTAAVDATLGHAEGPGRGGRRRGGALPR
jgi:hypothetical protein